MVTVEVLEKAMSFAAKKHKGQYRKGNKLPYFMHPMRVALKAQEVKATKNIYLILAVCFLHDTVEDCGVKLKTIQKKFGYSVAALVEELTLDKKKYETIGKTKYLCQEVLKMSSYALCIKLCDRLDNVSDMKSMDEEFRAKYKAETAEIIKTLVEKRKLSRTHMRLVRQIKKQIK